MPARRPLHARASRPRARAGQGRGAHLPRRLLGSPRVGRPLRDAELHRAAGLVRGFRSSARARRRPGDPGVYAADDRLRSGPFSGRPERRRPPRDRRGRRSPSRPHHEAVARHHRRTRNGDRSNSRRGGRRAPARRGLARHRGARPEEAETHVRRGENSGATLEEASVVGPCRPPAAAARPRRRGRPHLAESPDLAWQNVALVAFVQSETTRKVVAVAIDAPTR